MFRILALLIAVCSSIALMSCQYSGERWDGVVQDSAGIPIVLNGRVGVWSEENGWQARPDLRLGQFEGSQEFQFGEISGLAVGSEGEIIVLDRLAREVRVFDRDGRFLRHMARAGAGPGEVSQSVRQILHLGNGVLAVPDLALQRLALYRLDGSPAGSIPLDVSRGIPAAWAVSTQMEIIYQATILPFDGGERERQNVLFGLDRDGTIRHRFSLPAGGQLSIAGGRRQFRMFASEPRWTIGLHGGVITGMSGTYRLEVLDSAGALQRVITMPHEPRPIVPADQEIVRRSMEDIFVAEGAERRSAQEATSSMTFAENYPAFASIRMGPDSTVWVQHVRTPGVARADGVGFDVRQQGDRRWDLFDSVGRFLGVVVLPVGFELMEVRGRQIYGRAVDDSGVPQVVRLTLHDVR